MQLISKVNRGFRFLLYDIEFYSKYSWFIPLKDRERIMITNDFKTKNFQKVLHESNRKRNKIWLDKRSEFYNRLNKPFFLNNNIEIYSKYNVVAERFIRTLRNKIWKHMNQYQKMIILLN